MTNDEQLTTTNLQAPTDQPMSVWRCLSGAAIAAVFALGLYGLTSAIAQAFASHPLPTTNVTAQNISVAVRTLVIGISTLGTGIFAITALGLLGLALQLIIQRLRLGVRSHES
ncbi:MAG: DUF3082 domain-containing protein [Cyanobacteria bacterium]|nr:DUF3082 domain-containing protein [Cyanobacteriota bacterium]MDW8203079.1 DUF3082 domain-containing protein [Cyanobacteriota bacterium SKYGB_h_bin112]